MGELVIASPFTDQSTNSMAHLSMSYGVPNVIISQHPNSNGEIEQGKHLQNSSDNIFKFLDRT